MAGGATVSGRAGKSLISVVISRFDDSDRLAAFELRFEAAALARVRAVDVDVHERAQLVTLVEEQVTHGKSAQRGADRRYLQLELLLPARLLREERRQENGYCHSATSTDRIGGSCEAASSHSPPSSGETKTEPLCVPR